MSNVEPVFGDSCSQLHGVMGRCGRACELLLWTLVSAGAFAADPVAAGAIMLRAGDFVMLSPPWGGVGTQLVALDGTSATYAVIASGGYLSSASDHDGSSGLCVRSTGDILVTTRDVGVIRVDPSDAQQSVFASPGMLGEGTPSGIVAAGDGSVYVSMQSSAAPRVVQVSADGLSARVVTTGGFVHLPAGLCFGHDRALYVCETIPYPLGEGGGIVRVDPVSGAQTAIAGAGVLVGPLQIALAPDGTLWSVQHGGHSLELGRSVVRTRISDGYSEVISVFNQSAYGIAIRGDGTTVVGECYLIGSSCYSGSLVTQVYPSGVLVADVSGPVAVVPELTTPTTRRSWGQVKVIYR